MKEGKRRREGLRRTYNIKDRGIKAYWGLAKVGGKTWEK